MTDAAKGGEPMANRNHDPKKTHEIALSGLLFALAMALSFIEGTLGQSRALRRA